jgi:branched-chain amino acid transport system ATP-binding protein
MSLSLHQVTLTIAGRPLVKGVSLDLHAGEVVGLLGPNGAGKTTTFNCISGIYRPNEGRIRFAGQDITAAPRHAMVGLGIGRTFQNLALFRSMSVWENVLTGAHADGRAGFIASALAASAAQVAGAPMSSLRSETSAEYAVKAAYLAKFIPFITWPDSAFSSPAAPVTICVLGEDPFGGGRRGRSAGAAEGQSRDRAAGVGHQDAPHGRVCAGDGGP